MASTSTFKVSLPTQTQWFHTLVFTVVTFVSVSYAAWVKNGSVYSKSSGLVAISAGVAAVIGLAKGFLTTV